MSPRTPLAVATCLLLGLALYLGYLASGDPQEEPGKVPGKVPAQGDVVEPKEAAMQAGADQDKPQFDVVLHIDPIGKLLPPPPGRPTLRLWRGTTLVPSVKASWVAGSAAFPLARTVGGRQLVRFHLPGGRDIYRVIHVRRGNEDIDVRWLGSSAFEGRVVDADQQPIEGASVWLAGERAETDEDGRFHIEDLPRGRGLPLVIRAKGHASTFRVLDLPRPRDGQDAQKNTFALAAGIDLKVRFVAPVEDFTKGAVFVQPVRGKRDTRLLHHPFLMQAVEGGVPLDKDGIATVQGLPEGAMVRVSVWHPDTLVQQRPVVKLRRDKQQPKPQASIHADKVKYLVGKVHTDNQPVSGAWLVSGGAEQRTSAMLPPFLYLDGRAVSYAATAADGSYRLPVRGPTKLRVAALERLGLSLKTGPPTARRLDLVLPRTGPKDQPRLRLRFAKASGRTFRLEVRKAGRRVHQPLLLKDTDDHDYLLTTRMLADIRVEARTPDGSERKWSFEDRVVQGLVELPLDY